MDVDQFIRNVIRIAIGNGYKVEVNRTGYEQIDFGHKKLHSGHLSRLFPAILEPGARIGALIETVAPGRPCTHKPMKEIVAALIKLGQ